MEVQVSVSGRKQEQPGTSLIKLPHIIQTVTNQTLYQGTHQELLQIYFIWIVIVEGRSAIFKKKKMLFDIPILKYLLVLNSFVSF